MRFSDTAGDIRTRSGRIGVAQTLGSTFPFYSPFFLQKQTGNKFRFLSLEDQRAYPENDEEEGTGNRRIPVVDMDLIEEATTESVEYHELDDAKNYINRTLVGILHGNISVVGGNHTPTMISESDSEVHVSPFHNYTTTMAPPSVINVVPEFRTFDTADYAVFFAMLFLSTLIGIFYGCCGKRQQSTAEYLIAGRQMSTIPASLSLLCSFISAITILGNPLEIYFYGSYYGLITLTIVPLTLTLAYFYVPVFVNLQLTSAYEYFELRFSRSLRTLISFVSILQYILYMSIVVYGPSLAIGQVTGIDTKLSNAIIFIVCVFYSTIGGLKGVMVTDALQALIMIGSLITVVYKGTIDLGGPNAVWNIAEQYDRTKFFNFDPDPRTRHTFWTSVIGGYFLWLQAFAGTHSQVQRYLSMPSVNSVRRALALNMFGLIFILGLCYWTGLLLFAKYHDCDPVQNREVTKADQLLPLFVMQSMSQYPGLPGLFVAGITCASLSSVSTGLNALSAIVTYDYIRSWMPFSSDAALLLLSRCLCVLFGAISFGLIFLAEHMGNILPATFSIAGIVIGPTLGIFTLGMMFPCANARGSLFGFLSSFFIMITLVVGNQLANFEKLILDQTLPGLSTEMCSNSNTPTLLNSSFIIGNDTITAERRISALEEWGNEMVLAFFSISYMWYPALGCTLAMFFGLLFSLLIGSCSNFKPIPPDYLFPPVLWLIVKLFPCYALKWIDLDLDDCGMISSRTTDRPAFTMNTSNFTFNRESVCNMKLKRVSILPHQIRFPIPDATQQQQGEQDVSNNSSTASDSLL